MDYRRFHAYAAVIVSNPLVDVVFTVKVTLASVVKNVDSSFANVALLVDVILACAVSGVEAILANVAENVDSSFANAA